MLYWDLYSNEVIVIPVESCFFYAVGRPSKAGNTVTDPGQDSQVYTIHTPRARSSFFLDF